eukprot:CAMPEP_0205931674 /NCGR_PEP_ID=MMETSP1325-20131115/27825_1 /ASSEMBLY_ACC=CAM_ASM_000708 /TAXON_ID=236786 /ORGANISM="Florenciella sp., Strain RCC1007" /LENGTH=38 /DNA_ID= /DNA_START= /DNA_END= /DNA_ORIENTATION=
MVVPHLGSGERHQTRADPKAELENGRASWVRHRNAVVC